MSDLTRRVTIYGLFDLNDSEQRIVYVGQTKRKSKDRLSSHRAACRRGTNTPIYATWMRKVDPAHVGIVELATCEHPDRFAVEQEWIAKLGTHITQGGFNADDPQAGSRAATLLHPAGSPSRLAQAATLRATLATKSAKQKTSAASQANWQNPEYRSKVLATQQQRSSRGGQVSCHLRLHVARGVVSSTCRICEESAV